MKRIGIKDVAKAAGVSITTVSRALNGYSDISEETKEKVKKIVEELNYVPNQNARTLGGKSQTTIALLMSELTEFDESGMAFGVLSGAYHASVKHDCEFMLLTTNHSHQCDITFTQLCRQRNLDGLIVQGIRTDDPYYQELSNVEIPCVLIDLNIEGENISCISIDNKQAAYEAVTSLIGMGHQEIGILKGKDNADVSESRLAGYQKALQEANIPFKQDYVKQGDFLESHAYDEGKVLLSQYPEITAVFCCSDVMAMGMIRAAEEMGKNIPNDLSIVGFDDMPMAKYINGGLTTVRQKPFEMGGIAGELVYSMIQDPNNKKNALLPYEFVVRHTTKAR